MAYQFSNGKIASFKLESDVLKSWTIANINGQETSADAIVGGIEGLLWIAGKEQDYEFTDSFRTVKQNVIDNS